MSSRVSPQPLLLEAYDASRDVDLERLAAAIVLADSLRCSVSAVVADALRDYGAGRHDADVYLAHELARAIEKERDRDERRPGLAR